MCCRPSPPCRCRRAGRVRRLRPPVRSGRRPGRAGDVLDRRRAGGSLGHGSGATGGGGRREGPARRQGRLREPYRRPPGGEGARDDAPADARPAAERALAQGAGAAGREARHRRRLGQGRRRQVDDRLQPRPRPAGGGAEGRAPRRRHLRPVDAEAVRHPRQAEGAERPHPRADGRLRHQGHVDRLPHRRGGGR